MATAWWLDTPGEEATGRVERRPRGTFEARYNSGLCYRCRRQILRRDLCRFVRKGGVRLIQHYRCPDGYPPGR